jgi:hypothetical protein
VTLNIEQTLWQPADGSGGVTLETVYRSLPGSPSESVPFAVRLLENPKSSLALPGAVDLFGHDCIHAVLGRGLLPQDEAFVLGFTMGTDPAHRFHHEHLFRFCARWLYRGAYRFSRTDAEVFAFAVRAGRTSGAVSLASVDFRALWHLPLTEVRRRVAVDTAFLGQVHAEERARWPGTPAGARLPA